MKYSAPIDGIQDNRSTNCQSLVDWSSQNQSGTDTRKPSTANPFAIHRMVFSLCLLPNSSSTAPTSGVNMIRDTNGNSAVLLMRLLTLVFGYPTYRATTYTVTNTNTPNRVATA